MPIPERFNPGLEHVKAVSEGEALAKAQFTELMSKARVLWDAACMFPWSNDGKPVLFGAAKWCLTLSGYLRDAANALHWALDRDFVDLVRYQHKYLGGRFVSDETYAKDYAHIPAEMARLEAKLAERR